jgi:uncharacterized protein YdeI (YjbR/CyaY-like superfamily)
MTPAFFETPVAFRRWLAKYHATVDELWVGFYRKASGKPSITWPESVDEALCYGWIDGVRKSIDDESYVIRFTPRRPGSIWSARNVGRIESLIAEGRMAEPGMEAWRRRDEAKTGMYSFERDNATLEEEHMRAFRRNRKAWKFFQSQPPGYRRLCAWWIISARREETRNRRLAKLIAHSEAGERIPW